MTSPTAIDPAQLPASVRGYLDARAASDVDAALRAFTPEATITDEGRTYRGPEELLKFLQHAGAQYQFTIELVGAQRVDDRRWVASHRLEGNFPGGVAELDFTFVLDGDLVAELVIAPR
ncbi:nuclear transport factor 2 family protein [Nocardioides caldifontis]|uniref:nuclear transport factor 2 family protein n=1 Tax=Nocardioides caldifontis TaxID=2588938 RepID=UPI0011DF1FAA|nr:nuclear transport factor 2 family protein [Nocardioides caldifontis]